MSCPSCGSDNEPGVRFCAACGARLEPSTLANPAALPRPRSKTLFQGSGSSREGSGESAAMANGAAAPAVVVGTPPTGPESADSNKVTRADFNVGESPPGAHDFAAFDLTGNVIGNRYRLEERIGEGGFGAVYRSEHVQMGRKCALKVLHPRMAHDPQVVARFRREAQAASVLRDAHTVQIYDFDQDAEGIFYLAMELVRGRSLHSEIARGGLSVSRAIHILDGVAQSLGEAHEHGIVHRDIKPENVLLEERPGDSDFAKVLDFGIAKIVPRSNISGPALTAAGQTLGTVEYMSPEQLMGLDLDGRSDLYALGVLAYEMLTGSLPFVTKTPGEMISAHLKTQPEPPSQRTPERGIPPAVDAIVLKLLAKKREERYSSTAALQSDLRNALQPPQPAPVSALPPEVAPAVRPEAAATSTRVLPVPLMIGGAALIAVLLVLYFLFK